MLPDTNLWSHSNSNSISEHVHPLEHEGAHICAKLDIFGIAATQRAGDGWVTKEAGSTVHGGGDTEGREREGHGVKGRQGIYNKITKLY